MDIHFMPPAGGGSSQGVGTKSSKEIVAFLVGEIGAVFRKYIIEERRRDKPDCSR